jgi:hypothetical protein
MTPIEAVDHDHDAGTLPFRYLFPDALEALIASATHRACDTNARPESV